MTKIKKLIDCDIHFTDELSDYLLLVAMQIEDTFLTAGATPKVDYTYLDLIKLAQPFALEKMKAESGFPGIK